MDENEFFAKCWKYAITGFVVIILAGLGSCQATRYQIRSAIEAGATPIAAKCAIESVSIGVCTLIGAAEAESTRSQ